MLLCIAIFFFAVIALLCILHYSVRYSRKGKLIDRIPGPYAWPVFGNTFYFMVPSGNLWHVTRKLNQFYYPINRIWSVLFPIVNIYHPDDVEVLLLSTKNTEKSIIYSFLQPWLGTGLLTSKGAKWHQRRKILTPGFHFKILQQFVGIFLDQSEKLSRSVCQKEEEVVLDLESLLHKYTLNSICETTMGLASDVDGDVFREYRSSVSEMGDLLTYRMLRPWMHADWMFQYFQKCKEQFRLLKILHNFSTNIINERKHYHRETNGRYLKGLSSNDNSNLNGLNEEQVEGKQRLAMLDLLISAQNQGANINDAGIREEVDTFVFEGHDTTAMGLCFVLLLLAEHKEIQDKARVEVDMVFGDKEKSALSLRELQSLSYLERCIKESLRLFPSVPLISRYISEDIQLKKYLVPSGTMLNLAIYDLHRDPQFWPDPDTFNPDRFMPDQVQRRHPFAFVPFSAGPRNCIGQKFALLEMKALVGTFLRNFYLQPIDLAGNVQMRTDIVLRPAEPIRIKLIRR